MLKSLKTKMIIIEKYCCCVSSKVVVLAQRKLEWTIGGRREIYLQKWKIKFTVLNFS